MSLTDLPSRGNFTDGAGLTPGSLHVYLCDHDTRPPDGQIIQTDPTNILIRSLSLKKKEEAAKGQPKEKGKRPAESSGPEGPGASKRQNTGKAGAGSSGGSGPSTEHEMQSLTVDRLKRILKSRGLTTRGKKEELVARARQSLENADSK